MWNCVCVKNMHCEGQRSGIKGVKGMNVSLSFPSLSYFCISLSLSILPTAMSLQLLWVFLQSYVWNKMSETCFFSIFFFSFFFMTFDELWSITNGIGRSCHWQKVMSGQMSLALAIFRTPKYRGWVIPDPMHNLRPAKRTIHKSKTLLLVAMTYEVFKSFLVWMAFWWPLLLWI